jgi:type IV secretory pathway TraG/TraD family ATPase VirD4
VASKLMNEPDKRKSVILIDESPTIYLPNFEQIPATSRSNKIAVVVSAQDISQMRDKYGREKAEMLISNLGNQFFGRTTNRDTAERVVKLFGQNEHKVNVEGSSSGPLGKVAGFGEHFSKSQSIQKRDRIKIQQMTTLDTGEFAGLLAEGNTREFLGQIELQRIPDIRTFPNASDYTTSRANANFENIYLQMENFIADSKNRTERTVSDMDF